MSKAGGEIIGMGLWLGAALSVNASGSLDLVGEEWAEQKAELESPSPDAGIAPDSNAAIMNRQVQQQPVNLPPVQPASSTPQNASASIHQSPVRANRATINQRSVR